MKNSKIYPWNLGGNEDVRKCIMNIKGQITGKKTKLVL